MKLQYGTIKSRPVFIRSLYVILSKAWVLILMFITLVSGNLRGKAEEQTEFSPPKTIRIAFHDLPGVPFLGYLMAKEKGYYKELGLPPVEFIWQDDTQTAMEFLRNRQAELATSWMAEGLAHYDKNRPLVAISLVAQGTSAGFIVRSDTNPLLNALPKLFDTDIGIWHQYEATARAFAGSMGYKPEFVVQHGTTNELFYYGEINVNFSTSYHTFFLSKYLTFRDHCRLYKFSDSNRNFPEDTIFCRKSFLEANPILCRKFVSATYKGWAAVFREEEKALDLLLKTVRSYDTLGDHYLLKQILKQWNGILQLNAVAEQNGQCDENRYQHLINAMVKADLIQAEEAPSFDEFFYNVLKANLLSLLSNTRKTINKSERTKTEHNHE